MILEQDVLKFDVISANLHIQALFYKFSQKFECIFYVTAAKNFRTLLLSSNT